MTSLSLALAYPYDYAVRLASMIHPDSNGSALPTATTMVPPSTERMTKVPLGVLIVPRKTEGVSVLNLGSHLT